MSTELPDDIEQLKQMLIALQNDNQSLSSEVKELNTQNKSLSTENSELKNQLEEALAQLKLSRTKQFGKRSEKLAKGTFNDNEEAIKDVFGKKLRDKTQIASLSKAYYQLYKKDMWQHLNSFLSQSEMKEYVSNYVQRLPNYQS